MSDKRENFIRAFCHGGGCVRTCECGRVFYNDGGGWDWEEGELEELKANPNATEIDYTPGDLEFDGKRYVDACDCWHEHADRVIEFIESHACGIRDFLREEKKRKLREAEWSPVIEEGTLP